MRLGARRKQNRSLPGGWQEVIKQGQVFYVIPDQKPLAMGREPALNCTNQALVVLIISFR
jgi:hypothetical protein